MPSFGKKELGKGLGMPSLDEKELGKRLGMNQGLCVLKKGPGGRTKPLFFDRMR
jgi:hypothetical protein